MQRRVLGVDHPDTLVSMRRLAHYYRDLTRFEESETLYRETIEAQKRVLGDDHPDTLTSMLGRAILYRTQGHYDKAEPLFLDIIETRRRVLGDDHPDTVDAGDSLANLYRAQRRYDKAEPLYRKALEIRRRVLGDDHWRTRGLMDKLTQACTSRWVATRRPKRLQGSPILELPARSPQDEPDLRSIRATERAKLFIVNQTPHAIKIYWIDYDGKRRSPSPRRWGPETPIQ